MSVVPEKPVEGNLHVEWWTRKMKKEYEIYPKTELTKEILDTIKVGDRIKVNSWKRPFTVRAVSKNYFIMIVPFFDSYRYSICEKNKRGGRYNVCYRPECGYYEDEFVCGPDDHFCLHDYQDPKECEIALKELETGELEVSTRHGLGIWQIAIKRR